MKFILAALMLSLMACTSTRTVQTERDVLEIVYVTDAEENIIVGDAYNVLSSTGYTFPYAKIIPFEENYALVDLEWMMYNYLPYYKELVKQLNIEYSEQFDCEDFARMFKTETQKLYRKQAKSHQGLAIGMIVYYIGDGKSHAANIVLGVVNGNLGYLIIEPQNGSVIKASTIDKNSVWLIIL